MQNGKTPSERLSPWWRNSAILVIAFGFAVLIWMASRVHRDAPPTPEGVVNSKGETIFAREDILSGQQVFLKYGLMENGSIWGHGAYLGPDFSAEYLHTLAVEAAQGLAEKNYHRRLTDLTPSERDAVQSEVRTLLKQNRYDPYSSGRCSYAHRSVKGIPVDEETRRKGYRIIEESIKRVKNSLKDRALAPNG
jgi:nitric oxide reductase subunit B